MYRNNFRCDVCKLVFNTEKEWKWHSTSKEHSNAMQDRYEHSTVFVSGLSSYVDDDTLGNYFAQYGPVRKLKIVKKRETKGSFAFVTFEHTITVDNVLRSVHFLGQDQLKVSKKIYEKPNTTRISEKSKDEIHKELCYQLQTTHSVSESMDKLCESMQLTEKDFMVREELKQKIINVLKPYYPECEIHIYGSTMNGAGLNNSDVDLLFLPTSQFCNTDVPKDGFRKVPTLHDFKAGKVDSSYLLGLDGCSQLNFVNQVFHTYRNLFLRPIFITAKCPIINFCFHLRGVRMHCDLSCSNRLVLFNTQLMKLFADMDDRVRPLLLTIRYWAKYHGFVKTGILSSYALSLLVVFYLQNVQPPVLPTIKELQDKGSFSCIIAGWECGFPTDLNIFKPSDNLLTSEELLVGFFKFCLEFDFFPNILCISTGKVMSVKDFQMLDDPRLKDFNVSAMMIQDPFELSRNVSVTLKHNNLIAMKMNMNLIMESYRKEPCPIDLSPVFVPFNCKLITKQKAERSSIPCTIDFLHTEYYYLSEIFSEPDIIKTAWFEQASQAVFDVLQDGFMICCEIIDKKTTPFTICEETDYYDSETELLLSIQCSIYYGIWNGRNSTAQYISPENKNVLQVEREISQKVIENNPLLCYKEARFSFLCECFRYTKLNIWDILVLFTPLTLAKEFVSVAFFLKSNLPRIVEKVMEERRSSN